MLHDLSNLNVVVLQHTDVEGHDSLIQELAAVRGQWGGFLAQCQASESRLEEILKRLNSCDNSVAQLTEWLTLKECQVKEQSLKDTLEAKQATVDKLMVGI